MRRLLLGAVMCSVVTGARAADMPDFLRGSFSDGLSTATHNWDGYYVGGQFGFATSEIDFSHAPKSMTDFMLRDSVLQAPVGGWSLLPKNHVQATGFGAFVGRNWQYYDAVFGIEANYSYMNNLASSASDSMERLITNPPGETVPSGHTYIYDTALGGGAALQLKDYVTLRGRVGWSGGDFMPYAFGGLAIGRADVSRFATVSYVKIDQDNTTTPGTTTTGALVTMTQPEQRVNSFIFGWTGGLGLEYALFNCFILRGEWEHVGFSNAKDISVNLNNFRLGAAYQF